jgi:F-type H+-transporting ATPase subunit b
MIESARAAIQSEQDKALSAIRAEVVELSLSAASRVIGRQVGSEDDRRVVAEIVGGPADGAGA